MDRFECSVEKPWGIHLKVRNEQDCPRCGWTAPGPLSDARAARQLEPLTLPIRIAGRASAMIDEAPRKAA